MSTDFFARFANKTVCLAGLGLSNRPLIPLLSAAGARLILCDAKPAFPGVAADWLKAGHTVKLGPDYLDGIEADYLFRSPGLHPAALAQAIAAGARLTSEIELFFELCPCPIIGVTGSDGKTTTSTIISKILESSGYTVHLGGNIGTPLLPRIASVSPQDLVVCELSSFQLITMTRSPHTAVVTNITPNHLDKHRDMFEYIESKYNIIRHGVCRAVLNADCTLTRSFAVPGTLWFGSPRDSYVTLYDGVIYREEQPVLSLDDIRLPGLHNVHNYMAAIAATAEWTRKNAVAETAESFRGVPHRLELVAVSHGVRFVNDSIASTPTRTLAGLRSITTPLVLIAGGYNKGIPFEPLIRNIPSNVKIIVLTGATAALIGAGLDKTPGAPPYIIVPDLESAVSAARKSATPGDTVLFSPACASFDRYDNFEQRGEHFRRLISNDSDGGL